MGRTLRCSPPAGNRTRLALAILGLLLCTSVSAQALQPPAQAIRIPAGSLSRALELLGERNAVAILYEQRLLAGMTAPEVNATVTPQSGLDMLLAGYEDRLTWTQVNGTTFVITLQASASAPPPAASTQEPTPYAVSVADSATTLDSVSVIGRGSTRATAALSIDTIEANAPGVAAQNLLRNLPGINVQTSDPYALYEYSNSLRIRGFSSEQIGVSLDGVPLETSNMNEGGPITRYIMSEDLASIEVASGSGDVTHPSHHALGGSIRYISTDPSGEFGGRVAQTVGTDKFSRTYARLDTGPLLDGGLTAYFSAARTKADSYQIDGATQFTEHFDSKIKYAWGYNSITLSFNWDNRADHDYREYELDGTPAAWWPIYETVTGDPDHDAFYYEFWKNGRVNWLYSLRGEFQLSDTTKLEVVPYYEHKNGYAFYAVEPSTARDLYAEAVAGTPGRTDIVEPNGSIPVRWEVIEGERHGLTAGLTWEIGAHRLQFGGWYEENKYVNVLPLENQDLETGRRMTDLPIRIDADRHFDTRILQVYAKDAISLLSDKLLVEAGVKALRVERDFQGIANATDFNNSVVRRTSMKDSDWFQPQAGISYTMDNGAQWFANYAENFSSTPSDALVSVNYNPDIKPETSKNIDVGIRAERETWSGYAALYKIQYNDRIISLSTFDIQALAGESYVNVGDVQSYGLELSGQWRPLVHWNFNGSLSLNKSEFADDYYRFDETTGIQDVLVAVEGNNMPDQPKVSGSVSAEYRKGNWFANLSANYTGSRYGDTANTQKVDAYTLVDASVGYEGNRGSKLENVRLQLSFYNLTDEEYFARISTGEDYASYKKGSPMSAYASIEYRF